MICGLHPAGPFQLVHHPNQPVHMGLGSILSGRLMRADAMLCPAGPYGIVQRFFRPARMIQYDIMFGRSISMVHHPNRPVHMGLCSILSGRLIWADTMLCPACPFELVCCICPAGPYGMVQGFFRPAHMRQYDIMFGRSIWDDMWPSSGQSISTGTPSQPAGSYGIVLNLIRPAHMG